VGYRVWRWDATGLRSLNGVRWIPGQPLAARCNLRKVWIAGRTIHVDHDAPQPDCRCGVYASKNLDDLRSIRFWESGARSEVFLWGLTVEHERGFRSQFAYPKSLHLPPEALPDTLGEIELRLKALIAYRCDIYIAQEGASIPLWRNESRFDAAGLNFLMGRGKEWYARHKQERTLKPGDRVAILGRGIALVGQANDRHVHVVLWDKDVLRLRRKDIVWDEGNTRWEAQPACVRRGKRKTMNAVIAA
jgi:hypothetical protein